jgi:choline dehydrogenase-like flavoprotein
LNSSNPFEFPIINPGFLCNPLDGKILVQSIKTAQEMVATSPWKGFIQQPFGALATAKTDAQLLQFVRNLVTSFWHPSGTAKMGKVNDPMAVVNSKLQLKGVQGVRIVDTSVFVSCIVDVVWVYTNLIIPYACSPLYQRRICRPLPTL